MIGDATLSEHLHKLGGVKSEQELENLLQLLWQTRKTGLPDPQKSSLHSLLKLHSPGDLEPVLASLRYVIWSCVHKNVEGDDIMKLLPPDLPLELHSVLLVSLQKHRRQWKGELSQEQVNAAISAPSLPFPSSEVSRSLLSLQVYPLPQLNGPNLRGPAPTTAERNVMCFPELTLQNDAVPPETLGVLPRVKSMTWTVENKSATPANRVATITLKLQDYTKSPTNEMEVKFQLTKDTLEAVLRSMAYINEQLSRFVRSSSGPSQKKQRKIHCIKLLDACILVFFKEASEWKCFKWRTSLEVGVK
ncbi:protein FAR1-RELATED SEQUENCE 3 [Sesamum alatum]|uniref:Protein FAR1-RELATED SEQUENCE 3 n=1 Tax=Sesamum alatum TaxID=300844 RepID=A0AAE1XJ55_9LAMI|nr:protein FAR1-RELATED SEQUENCE 3 [Sesamum alatum]